MKKLIYIIIIGMITLCSSSCIKNNGNDFIPDLPVPSVTGFEKSYTTYTRRDVLSINPTVKDESLYTFEWRIYSSNFVVSSGVIPKGDLIASTKNLNYTVLLNPGPYILTFNVTNKQTGIKQILTSTVNVSTLTMNGWYLLKDNGTTTDFDFIYPTGRIDNWMAFHNDGKSLKGKAIKSIYAGSFKMSPASTDLFGSLFVISDQDAGIYRIDNGKQMLNADNMFFTKPAVFRPQNILQPQADQNLRLINDGKVYTMNKGALFTNPPLSTYTMSAIAGSAGNDVMFDLNSKSVITVDNSTFVPVNSLATTLKNMNAEPIWIGAYAGLRSVVLELFRRANGEGYLVKLFGTYGPLAGYSNPLDKSIVVPQTHGLMSADVIAGNYDADYIYYAKGNKIYITDIISLTENLQVTLGAGEQVTAIQHIKYPLPGTTTTPTTVITNYLSIASYVAATGKYKVYLHNISSTGTIQALALPNFEGTGKVSSVNFIENGVGNKTY
ncbi:hypothetical protein LPB86_10770 [Pedobacter sp. MC2016-14]|uniref:PKD-like family lipoprotein n=1 Tax=Pedobacter sp. MC2016-14 TaxID=2897327 RepID=UPI001E5B9C2D|nr:PKD-like family lipoprotein [Pedobacter sp. MC2016-14]MCD0488717.1 hypothetical protein [Pedobacter sp. MC2016-14]